MPPFLSNIMAKTINIVKKLTGEVIIKDFASKFAYKELAENAALFLSNEDREGGVWVVDENGQEFHILTKDILRTEIEPNPSIVFAGGSRQLYELLETSFFYNLVNPPSTGGGGVVESNILLKGVNYTITTSDYIIASTASITLTMPATPNIGQLYKIFANNNTTIVNANAGQTIIGQPNVSIKKYSAVMIQYISINNWLII